MMILRSATLLATAAAVSQQKDWLVRNQDAKTRLVKTASGLRLTNGLVERTFATQPDGYFCTTDLRRGDRSFFRALAPEGNVTLNGQPFNIGGCLGQPDNHYEFWYAEHWPLSKDPAAFVYRNYSLTKPSKSFEWRARSGAPSVPWPPRGLRLTIEFAHASLQNVRVFIHYEMYDNIPAYRKLVSIRNDGSETVTVDSLVVELFRAQNWGPQRITALAERWDNSPVPNDQQVPAVPDSLLRESPRYWYADPSYDQCCDDQCMNQIVAARRRRVDGVAVWPPNSPIDLRAGDDTQLHVPYTAYTFLVAGYTQDVRYGGATGPGWALAPGSSRSSSSLRVVLHDCDDTERQGLGVRETLKTIAPQLTEAPVNFMLSDLSALRRIVDQAAKTGHELGIIGFGAEGWCAFCSEQTEDGNFTEWLAGEVRYAKQKNIRLSAYTLMQGNGWGMDPIPEDAKIMNRDGSRGPTACFATDWHASYRQRVLTFAAKVGFYGVETDGQFEGASCSDPTHSHHGVSNSFDAQLKATQRFNNQLKARGLYQTGADAYVFSGANRWNAADTVPPRRPFQRHAAAATRVNSTPSP